MVASLKLKSCAIILSSCTVLFVLCKLREGGAWGIAVLARYMIETETSNLATYLNDFAFKGTESMTIEPTKDEVASFEQYTDRFKQGIPLERLAHEQFNSEQK